MSQPSLDFGDPDRYADALSDRGFEVEEFEVEEVELTYTVGELAEAINARLRGGFSEGVWVRGEIQGYQSRGSHRYFRLVDTGENGKASINIGLFAPMMNRLRPLMEKARLRLTDGLKVRIYGHLDFYAPSGQLSLKMAGIDTRFTIGDIEQQRQDTVRRLVASGLYDANRALRLSPVPLRIGVVTSADSAAWADFRAQLEASGLGFHLRLIDCRVQGEFAVRMVSAAIRTLGRCADLDAIAVIRGGGARSELVTFDHLAIATAIARSTVPVFTGLGHEIDRSVADDVAYRPLKTPTAVAAALVGLVEDYARAAEQCYAAIDALAGRTVDQQARRVDRAAAQIHRQVLAAVQRGDERLDVRTRRLRHAVQAAVTRAEQGLAQAVGRVGRSPERLPGEERHLNSLAARVRLLDPVHTMARGWSITRTTDGQVVRDATQLQPGQQIVTAFAAGTATSTVEHTDSNPPESGNDALHTH